MNIWKLGTKWGSDAPDFYEYILGEGIVLNHPSGGETAKKGDYMLVTRGFTVLAIAVLLEDVKPVTDNPDLETGFAKHKIEYEEWVSYAKADYRVLSAEEQFRYEQRKGIVRVHDSLTIQRTLSLMGEMTAIHQSCFKIWEAHYQERDDFYIRFRDCSGAKGEAFAKKGYWFLGDEQNCILSFWKGDDPASKTPNIYLNIGIDGLVRLVFSTSKYEEGKEAFFKSIAASLRMERRRKKDREGRYWERQYPAEMAYSDILTRFINTDKKIIDLFLQEELGLFGFGRERSWGIGESPNNLGFISTDLFEERYSLVQELEKQFKFDPFNPKQKVVEETIAKKDQHFRLERLVLENIGHFERLELDLSSRIICLLGHNGSGKSTVLRALALGLVGVDDNSLLDIEDRAVKELLRIDTMAGGDTLAYPFKGKILLDYVLGKQEDHYTNQIDLYQSAGIKPTVVLENNSSSRKRFGLFDGDNRYKQLVLGFPQMQTNRGGEIDSEKRVLSPNIKDVLPLIYNWGYYHYEALGKWIQQLEADRNSPHAKSEEQVLELIFKVLSKILDEDIIIDEVEHVQEIIWLKVSGQRMPFHLLSQGFRNVFAWVGRLIRRLYESADYDAEFYSYPAIVLIDEIDTYLHPKWQRKILDALAEEFRNTQFIVSTHSPLVASYLEAYGETADVYILKPPIYQEEDIEYSGELDDKEYDPSRLKPIKFTYGRDITDIFFEWMGVEQRDEEVTQEIDAIFALIEEENAERLAEARQRIEALKLPAKDADMFKLKFALKLAEEELED